MGRSRQDAREGGEGGAQRDGHHQRTAPPSASRTRGICDAPRQKLHATIFDPPPPRPPRPEVTEPDAAEDVRRRETAGSPPWMWLLWMSGGSGPESSCMPADAERVAIGGSSVWSEGLREPACGGGGGTP